MKLTVVIPVYNEKEYIRAIIRRVQDVEVADLEKELIIVDDCSTDGTRDILREEYSEKEGIRLFFHEKNQGKGKALQTGFEQVRGDWVIVQDADLEYDPREYPKLLEPLLDGRADVVYGSRFLGGPHRVLFFWHYLGNKLLTLLSNIFNNINLTDMETCYKAFRVGVLQGLTLRSNRFGFEPEFTAKIARRKYRIYETPISYSGRSYEEGKKITWKDGISALYCIVRFSLFD